MPQSLLILNNLTMLYSFGLFNQCGTNIGADRRCTRPLVAYLNQHGTNFLVKHLQHRNIGRVMLEYVLDCGALGEVLSWQVLCFVRYCLRCDCFHRQLQHVNDTRHAFCTHTHPP